MIRCYLCRGEIESGQPLALARIGGALEPVHPSELAAEMPPRAETRISIVPAGSFDPAAVVGSRQWAEARR